MEEPAHIAVVALGGNALSTPDEEDSITNRFARTRRSLIGIIELIRKGYRIAITHGNGPQVGNALLRVEMAYPKAPRVPLGVLVADTEGSIGYMIEQSLQNMLKLAGVERDVVTIVSQVLVDKDDPSLANPTKYIGQFYPENEAKELAEKYGWIVKDAGNHGWRRVVGSPIPKNIINGHIIRNLTDSGMIVISAGGGGIPVYLEDDGRFEGVDAVIDKDRAAAILGRVIGARELIILTNIEKVCLNYGKPNQHPLDKLTVSEAKDYHTQGHFPPGSMGPKIEAAITFLEHGGEKVIITHLEQVLEALHGEAGTWVIPD
ncbi:MAG: carbamate kinase [candidate division Zixibacteria bacterium]|nr:carbamate kinase [Candidatus Tariuqbacter arcticus]